MIDAQEIFHDYGRTSVLRGVTFRVEPGTFAALVGPSGCGKSTLLFLCGAMLRVQKGSLIVDGEHLAEVGTAARARFRSRCLGFVFQQFHLVPYLTVAENVRVAALAGARPGVGLVRDLLDSVGLATRSHCRPEHLSVGERQRCALARALYGQPRLILADEPTGNLDPDNAAVVLRTLSDFSRAGGTVLMVTHDPRAAAMADVRLRLSDGRIREEG